VRVKSCLWVWQKLADSFNFFQVVTNFYIFPSLQSRARSPIPTGGQPYWNVGQTPKDRMRYQVIMEELRDLPRPFVIEVLEKTKGMRDKEEILQLMEK